MNLANYGVRFKYLPHLIKADPPKIILSKNVNFKYDFPWEIWHSSYHHKNI